MWHLAFRRVARAREVGAVLRFRAHAACLSSTPQPPDFEELTVSDVLAARGLVRAVELDLNASVLQAMKALTKWSVGSALASRTVKERKIVAGVFTARDLLRWMHERSSASDAEDAAVDSGKCVEALSAPISRLITPAEKVAWCSPTDKLVRVRLLMRQLGTHIHTARS